jgi:hypothetical protein
LRDTQPLENEIAWIFPLHHKTIKIDLEQKNESLAAPATLARPAKIPLLCLSHQSRISDGMAESSISKPSSDRYFRPRSEVAMEF